MSGRRNTDYLKWFLFLLILVLGGFLLFNSKGLLRYWEAKKKTERLELQIKETERKIKFLESEIDSLKNSERKIEEIAREKYYMLKPNEEVLKVERRQK
jgi:cell division protein FtsB